jgi:ATP sulfurylase
LGEILLFGRDFIAVGAFFLKNIAHMIWAQFFQKIAQNSP